MASPHIVLEVHGEGSVVPVLIGFSSDTIENLRMKGVEVLNDIDPQRNIVYVKSYSDEEMAINGAEGFHAGYSLSTFFLAFPELAATVDPGSIAAFVPFLEESELAAIQQATPSNPRCLLYTAPGSSRRETSLLW